MIACFELTVQESLGLWKGSVLSFKWLKVVQAFWYVSCLIEEMLIGVTNYFFTGHPDFVFRPQHGSRWLHPVLLRGHKWHHRHSSVLQLRQLDPVGKSEPSCLHQVSFVLGDFPLQYLWTNVYCFVLTMLIFHLAWCCFRRERGYCRYVPLYFFVNLG